MANTGTDLLQLIRTQLRGGLFLILLIFASPVVAQQQVSVTTDGNGSRIVVDGKELLIKGMNWDYMPIGTNYNYSLWTQPEEFIAAALDREMPLLKAMGVNAIRQYAGVPARWITYIYDKFGIFTILNHSFGRYGVTVNGAYIPNTDYADPATRQTLLAEVAQLVQEQKNTRGLLLWLLGNENNYGLFWGGAATEDIPKGETLESVRARHMYALFNEAVLAIHAADASHPVAMANGDLLFIDIIAETLPALDIFGTNMYRGVSFGDAFTKVKEKLNKPMLFTEFGSDAYNAKEQREDQMMQSRYFTANWQEIYENSWGKGLAGNCIGGFTFQFSDGWWKHGLEADLDKHDTEASWSNGGYKEDFQEGVNNMNEEWFGVCAKGPTDAAGFYENYPRSAYYALQQAFSLDAFAQNISLAAVRKHFAGIDLTKAYLAARGDNAALLALQQSRLRVSGVRIDLETFYTGGSRITTPAAAVPGSNAHPAFTGFDHLQSVYTTVEAKPLEQISGSITVNLLGNVPQNPIDEIFYENRGLPKPVKTPDGQLIMNDYERIKLYNASIQWDNTYFKLHGFYRIGHYHWGYEGDFFGLYPEANYGINADIYNASAPLGVEVTGKSLLEGFKLAYGPELWWGANPSVLLKYRVKTGALTTTLLFQDDISKQGSAVSSFAVPVPVNRKATAHFAYSLGMWALDAGGIWSGSTKKGQLFQIVTGSSGNYTILQDRIKSSDSYGGKLKVTYTGGTINWYAQSSVMGLVADGGADQTVTFTGWKLKDCGSGNQYNVLSGFTYTAGNWQIAPNFLWQKPIEAPIPGDVPSPGRPRNVLADPFAVRGNRETTAGELMINYDPTPATWLFSWDNDIREDAALAVSAGVIFRHQPTTKDAAIGILGDGRTLFPFPSATMARDIWESYARIVSKLNSRTGLILNLYGGNAEPNGSDQRLVTRFGAEARIVHQSLKLMASCKVNDWGPYDYHRDFNITYPLQLMADLSTSAAPANWFNLPQTQIGVRYTWRSLNQFSNRYAPIYRLNEVGTWIPVPDAPNQPYGREWEFRTYMRLSI